MYEVYYFFGTIFTFKCSFKVTSALITVCFVSTEAT